ncbi:hypothetical protein ES707_17465 [subsurface metagenome]
MSGTKRRKRPKTKYVSARVTEQVMKEVDRVVYIGGYTNVGDYVRNLIRKDFKERGITLKMEEDD